MSGMKRLSPMTLTGEKFRGLMKTNAMPRQ